MESERCYSKEKKKKKIMRKEEESKVLDYLLKLLYGLSLLLGIILFNYFFLKFCKHFTWQNMICQATCALIYKRYLS